MTRGTSYYDELETLLKGAYGVLAADLSEQDRNDVEEYLEHGEYGVAYDLLRFLVENEQLVLPESLTMAGRLMGMCE